MSTPGPTPAPEQRPPAAEAGPDSRSGAGGQSTLPTKVKRPPTRGSATDRLGLTLFVAVVLHAMVILGVGFVPHMDRGNQAPTLDVTLVQQATEEAPDKADKLAQANQKGGGQHEHTARPSQPVTGKVKTPQQGLAPEPQEESAPAPQPEPKKPQQRVVTAETSEQQRAPKPEPKPRPEKRVDADELVRRSMKMASLTSELDRTRQRRAEKPRERYVTARTREHVLASYIESWVGKVERIGNLNYPEAARQQRLKGSLLLDVALQPDGTVKEVELVRSSGHTVLDEAAIRIVELAAPYAPFPEKVRQETDILHIIRTWQFTDEGNLLGKRR